MLTILSWAMIIVFMILIMRKKLTPFSALILIPLIFTAIGSFLGLYADKVTELNEIANPTLIDQILIIGDWSVEGIKSTSITAVMLLFAILYFAIMLNAGLFDPVTKKMIQFAKGDPVRIIFATAVVAAAVSLNGDGTTTTLIVCTAFIPIYKKLGMKLMNLGVVTILMNTIMNLLPWGGPTARVISVLGVDEQSILRALVPGMIVSIVFMLGVAVYLGLKERKRIGIQTLTRADIEELTSVKDPDELALRRPKKIWINLILTLALLAMLIFGTFPSVFLFLVGTALALVINYDKLKDQKNRIQDNAGDAVQVVILVLGAGIFMGLFTGSGMADALALSLARVIPTSFGRYWGLIVAVLSAPGTFFLSNDAFYYGVLPVLAEAGAQYGFTTLELGVASLLGQAYHLLSPLVAFIYLLLNLTGLDMGEWQKESAKWATGIFIIFIAIAAITGSVPLFK
ncbi:citrate:proton symporter [Tissierella sp. Yu-01]|uniref:CitMHS family transporter n=1 Tax=Tissierella sp. Yu-01 TaxID=3035694 RepID=UPI00240E41DB|nr:citrate:proton symporter [Tissierella sp. Yu-01]WFA08142.1 citrate:proton symporter [Tissierella sp. Yu-01]